MKKKCKLFFLTLIILSGLANCVSKSTKIVDSQVLYDIAKNKIDTSIVEAGEEVSLALASSDGNRDQIQMSWGETPIPKIIFRKGKEKVGRNGFEQEGLYD